ncbi:hypothetical protein PoB_006030300 [Plakobranchus ocellatus]|uniref:Uncharacterized protein n=1 Tax=Plakobranchus ocellatus TaxID=259542 RepID=A0AAV4CPK7_9GAST|nr:hypothetical protein PoB_006030300 [Plakobranchus ocellatus]
MLTKHFRLPVMRAKENGPTFCHASLVLFLAVQPVIFLSLSLIASLRFAPLASLPVRPLLKEMGATRFVDMLIYIKKREDGDGYISA